MNCPYCGNAVPDGAAFCRNCGAKLEAATIPAGLPPQASAEIPQEPMSPPPGPVMEPMAPPPGFTPGYGAPPPPPAKKSNTTLIIVVILVVLLLCCCCGLLIAISQMGSVFTDIAGQMLVPTPKLR